MIALKKLSKLVLSLLIIFGSFSFFGMMVRNIHHPVFGSIKEPIIFVTDIPKELVMQLKRGIETHKRQLPEVLLNVKENDKKIIKDGFYFRENGKIYHSKRSTVLTEQNNLNGLFYINDEENFVYKSIGDSLTKLSLDKNGSFVETWKLNTPTLHHLLNVDKRGYIYAPTYFPVPKGKLDNLHPSVLKLFNILSRNGAPPYSKSHEMYRDDGILIISPEGKIEVNKSLTEIFHENGLEYLIYTHGLEVDPFHLNSVFPAEIKKGFVEVGDLLLSLRHMSMLLVYRPSSGKIVWYQSGPWLNQHSAKFDNQGDIYVFDNNLIDTHYNRRRESYDIPEGNKLLRMSVENGKIYEFAPCSIDPTIHTVTGGVVTLANQTVRLSYDNLFTTVLCDLETGQKVFLKPETDSNHKTVPGTGISFIQFSD